MALARHPPPDLLTEWHPTRNVEIDPYKIGQHSHRSVWWRCSQCSHEWRGTPNHRTSGKHGCPACGRRRSIEATILRSRITDTPRERSLAVVRPDLLREWHPTRNGDLDPIRVAAGSEQRARWRCPRPGCGREWAATVGDRAKRTTHGCPQCAYRAAGAQRASAEPSLSLAALYPHLLDEWHPTANEDLDPFSVKPSSERRVWWRCSYCSKDWQVPPQSRRRSPRGGCPTCAIRLARGIDLQRTQPEDHVERAPLSSKR